MEGSSSSWGAAAPALGFGRCLGLAPAPRKGSSKSPARGQGRWGSPALPAQLLCLAKVAFGTSPPPLLLSKTLSSLGGLELCDFATTLRDGPSLEQLLLRDPHTG